MAYRVVLDNFKGGAGKTTLTMLIAYVLAMRGRRVLVVDMDPQGNATTAFGVDIAAQLAAGNPGIAGALAHRQPAPIASVAVPCGWIERNAARITVVPGLAPLDLEARYKEAALLNASERLRRALDTYERAAGADGPHVVLIDKGPGLGHAADLCATAADGYVLAITPFGDAVTGAQRVLQYVDDVRDILDRPELAVIGAVMTAYDRTNVEHVGYLGDLPTTLPGVPVWETLPRWESVNAFRDAGVSPGSVPHAIRSKIVAIGRTYATAILDAEAQLLAGRTA